MKTHFPIYIDRASIDSLVEINSRNLDCIFSKMAEIYIDMEDEEIDIMESCPDHTNSSDIGMFFRKLNITPRSGKSAFEKINIDNLNSFSNFIGYILILDITKDKAHSISQETGVWILSKEEIDNEAECFVLECIKMEDEDVVPNFEYKCSDKNGWKALFDDRMIFFPPFNEIVIYDNFIKEFNVKYKKPPYPSKKPNQSYGFEYIGLENLLILFNAILPKNHHFAIEILIALPKYTTTIYEERLENRIQCWIDEVKALRCYPINVSCLLIGNKNWREKDFESHPVHPRVLYTNYFFIKTEKGFKIFEAYPYSNIVREDGESNNSVSVSSYFSNPKMKSNPISANLNNKLSEIGAQLNEVDSENDLNKNTLLGDKICTESISLFDEIDFN